MKYFLKLFLLLTCPVFISASEINQTTFAYWNKPDVEIYYISPDIIDENTQVIFVIHGNSRNAEDYLSEWRPYIANKNVIVVAPKFTKESFKYFALLEREETLLEISFFDKFDGTGQRRFLFLNSKDLIRLFSSLGFGALTVVSTSGNSGINLSHKCISALYRAVTKL